MVFISASNKNYTIEDTKNVTASIISVAKNRFVVARDVNQRDTVASIHTDKDDTNIANRNSAENHDFQLGTLHISL